MTFHNSVIGRLIIAVIATVCFYMCLQSYLGDHAGSSRADILILGTVIIVILLGLVWRARGWVSIYLNRANIARKPGRFLREKLDCYVRVKGQISGKNSLTAPVSGKNCTYYRSDIFAVWETKRRKPGRGMETQRKPLLRDESSPEFAIHMGEDKVYIRAREFSQNALQLHNYENKQKKCPEQIAHRAASKYQNYEVFESFACDGDTVLAQGKLTRDTDGRFFLVPSGLLEFPSFVAKRGRGSSCDHLQKIIEEAQRLATVQLITTFALVCNALLVLYFMLA
jgi:hypothetical protein